MSEIVFRGYLYKCPPEGFGSTLKPWRLRWCILADSRLAFPFATPYVRLEYFTNEQLADELDEPKGVIDLRDCTEVVDRRPMRGRDHVFDLCTDKRAYHFAAPSMEIKSVWMESLTAVLRNNTERFRVDPTVFLRMGIGNNAGNISMNSPIYSSFQRSNNTSSENESVEIEENPYARIDGREINNESTAQPVKALANAHNLQDDYQHLQHRNLNDVNPPPVSTSANYNSLTRPFLQDDDDVDDYHHLDHNNSKLHIDNNFQDDYQHLQHRNVSDVNPPPVKPGTSANYNSLTRPFLQDNHNGTAAATNSNSTSLYGHLNRTEDNNYHHLNHQHSTNIATSVYNSSDMRDDYQHLDNCTLRPYSKGGYQNTKYATIGDTSCYSQPRVPVVPARKQTYDYVTYSPSTSRK